MFSGPDWLARAGILWLCYIPPSSRQTISILVLAAWSMMDFKLELLHKYCPSSQSLVRVFHSFQPSQRPVISDQCEGLSVEVVLEVLQSPYCCKTLFLDGTVAGLSGFELSTGVSDGVFLTILPHLAQHCSSADI